MIKRKHILFKKVGMSYLPTSPMGFLYCGLYCGMGVLLVVLPQIMFPDSRIVSAYQVATFLLFWWLGLRFAKRHSA